LQLKDKPRLKKRRKGEGGENPRSGRKLSRERWENAIGMGRMGGNKKGRGKRRERKRKRRGKGREDVEE
jgi:hypothetical protein